MQKTSFYMLFLVLSLAGLTASGQSSKFSNTPVTDDLGRPIHVDKYSAIKGSPYLYDDWLPGEVITNDGKVYKKMLIRFNAVKDELAFVYNKTDEPQKFAEPIRMFTITADRDRVFANQFPKIDGQNTSSYYEVLIPGNTMLLKRRKETLKPSRSEMSRADVDGVYANRDTYYLYKDKDKVMQLVKPNRDEVLKLLADKTAEVTAYADSQKINFEKEEDLKKLFNYYNTLQ